jgi:hypothetical protein
MTTYNFSLIVEGPDLQTDEAQDALFEAGCSDATIGSVDGVQYLEFDREAGSYGMALTSSIKDLERAIRGIRVVHVEPDELVTASEIAKRVNRTRESIRLLISGERGPGDFPPPVTHLRSRTRLWRWPDVLRWFATRYEDEFGEVLVRIHENPYLTASLNALLSYRRYRDSLSPEEQKALDEITG